MNRLLSTFGRPSENLQTKLLGHLAGILLMAVIFGGIVFLVDVQRENALGSLQGTQKYLDIRGVDFGDPLDRALFRESLEAFYPAQTSRNDSLLRAIDELRQRQFSDPQLKAGRDQNNLTWSTVGSLSGMFIQFVLVYAIVLAVLYLAAQRIAVFRFITMKQHHESYLAQTVEAIRDFNKKPKNNTIILFIRQIPPILVPFLKATAKGLALVVLFSPSYVIAYSLKTALDTSSLLFMALLGIVSNGVLILTANRFFLLLISESRKGYVQTATVKNLNSSFEWNAKTGITLRSLLRFREEFPSHVFGHIFRNARFQFIPLLKEHASFLITGLMIIEMALNIQGHLCYELLQRVLFRQYDVVCVIIFGIFLIVKATEVAVDLWHDWEKRKYGY
ncbi:MAG: hypothetical protein WBD36_13160 [Bacteroidota bacterium]